MRTQQFTTTLVLVVVFLLVSAPTLATATPAATERPPDLTDAPDVEVWFDETMADQMERHHVPGATVVLVANDTVVLAKGYGYAEVASPSLALRVGTVLPYVALVGTIAAVGATGLAWRDDYWGLVGRLHYSLVTVAAILVAWQLYYLRILPL